MPSYPTLSQLFYSSCSIALSLTILFYHKNTRNANGVVGDTQFHVWTVHSSINKMRLLLNKGKIELYKRVKGFSVECVIPEQIILGDSTFERKISLSLLLMSTEESIV